jgi:DNA repair photolyase
MPPIRITEHHVHTILSPAGGYMDDYDYSITPFRGCLYGCSYCYVATLFYFRREAKTWGYALEVKGNAPAVLLRAAKAGKLAGRTVYLSPNTDPYFQDERARRVMRGLLEVCCDYPPGLLVIQTRSPLVTRDLDLLTRLGEHVVVAVSITTDREDVRRLFEPRCAPLPRRVDALAQLHAHGIRTQASLAPLLPCDPLALAQLVDPHCDWVVVQALKMASPGARTWTPALEILRQRGWEGWLQGGQAVEHAMQQLGAYFGARYHEAQEGFGLQWARRADGSVDAARLTSAQ